MILWLPWIYFFCDFWLLVPYHLAILIALVVSAVSGPSVDRNKYLLTCFCVLTRNTVDVKMFLTICSSDLRNVKKKIQKIIWSATKTIPICLSTIQFLWNQNDNNGIFFAVHMWADAWGNTVAIGKIGCHDCNILYRSYCWKAIGFVAYLFIYVSQKYCL